jgi:hypothetical protein
MNSIGVTLIITLENVNLTNTRQKQQKLVSSINVSDIKLLFFSLIILLEKETLEHINLKTKISPKKKNSTLT